MPQNANCAHERWSYLLSVRVKLLSGIVNPLVSKVELANTLRQLRHGAGKTLEDAADILEMSAASISRIENAARIPRARDVRELCRAYGVTDEARISELAGLVARARQTGWWQDYSWVDQDYSRYIGLESAASRIEAFENTTVPALLQEREYAEIYFRDVLGLLSPGVVPERSVSERIEVRERRRRHLAERSGSVVYSVILDEAVLHRKVGSREIMRTQIRSLIHTAEEPWVDIQILPLERGALTGPVGSFTVLTLPQEQVTDVVYNDTLRGQEFDEVESQVELHKRVLSYLRGEAWGSGESVAWLRSLL